MQEAQNRRRTQGTQDHARTQRSDKTPLPGHGGATEGEKKSRVLVSSAYEEALEQAHNLGALIWAAQETDDQQMRESFIDLMDTPFEKLLEALAALEHDL